MQALLKRVFALTGLINKNNQLNNVDNVDKAKDVKEAENADSLYESKLVRMQLQACIEKAKHDWLHACSYFESVTEPDLVDYAVYSMKAEEKKYSVMLKKLKEIQ